MSLMRRADGMYSHVATFRMATYPYYLDCNPTSKIWTAVTYVSYALVLPPLVALIVKIVGRLFWHYETENVSTQTRELNLSGLERLGLTSEGRQVLEYLQGHRIVYTQQDRMFSFWAVEDKTVQKENMIRVSCQAGNRAYLIEIFSNWPNNPCVQTIESPSPLFTPLINYFRQFLLCDSSL